jgi:asparagine synthase (glutamine-hydrolysing)
MSGIAGMVNPFEDILLKSVNICSMSDAIRTRGANGAGHFISPHAVLLRRVGSSSFEGSSVTKITIEGKTYVLTLDVVIFNSKELATELDLFGFECSSASCPELIIYAYIKWKEDFLKRLNGIFAIALWIAEDEVLILARDQVGAKPLFYYSSGSTLLFSSDIRGITCNPLSNVTMDSEGLSELICLSPRHTPGCGIIKGIYEVRPGCWLHYSKSGLKNARYWRIKEQPHEDDLGKTLETVRELIIDSVKRQMQSDVPLSGLLSGGLYSSLITAIAAENSKLLHSSIYNTWSVDFEKNNRGLRQRTQNGDSDTPWVRWVCRRVGTRHHYIILSSSDLADSLLDASEARGIPGMPDYDNSIMLLFREIRKDFSIVLSGDCSDEVFGSNIKASEHFTSGKRRLPWASNLSEKISIFKNDIIELIKPYEFIEKCYEEALAEYLKFAANSRQLAKGNEAQWFSLYWNLPCLLERLDRMGMACGLDVRVPFCDVRLIEYFWNIPPELRQLNNMDRGLLREAMRGHLPSDILERKKYPYPRIMDPDYEMKIKNMLFEIIQDPGSPVKPLLNLKTLESMMKQQQDLSRSYTSRSGLYGWIIQLNHFMKLNGITSF